MIGKVIKNKQMKHNKLAINFTEFYNPLFIVFSTILRCSEWSSLFYT